MTYTPTDWVDNVTLVDASKMDKIEQGIVDAHAEMAALDTRLDAEEIQPNVPTVVNGQWLKGSGGALVWSAIAEADVTGLTTALAAKQATSAKGAANGYAGLDANAKVPVAQLPTAPYYNFTLQSSFPIGTTAGYPNLSAHSGVAGITGSGPQAVVAEAGVYFATTSPSWAGAVGTVGDWVSMGLEHMRAAAMQSSIAILCPMGVSGTYATGTVSFVFTAAAGDGVRVVMHASITGKILDGFARSTMNVMRVA